MADLNNLNVIDTSIQLNTTGAETSMGQFAGVINEVDKAFSVLNKTVKDMNISIASRIKKEINNIKDLSTGTIESSISQTFKARLEKAMITAFSNKDITIKGMGGKTFSITLNAAAQKKINSKMSSLIAKSVSDKAFTENFTITLNATNQALIKEKMSKSIANAMTKDLSIKFQRFEISEKDGKKVKIPIEGVEKLTLSPVTVKKIFETIEKNIAEHLTKEGNIAIPEVGGINLTPLSSVMEKISLSMNNKLDLLTESLIAKLNNVTGNMKLFAGGENTELEAVLKRTMTTVFSSIVEPLRNIDPALISNIGLTGMYETLNHAASNFLNEYMKIVSSVAFNNSKDMFTTRMSSVHPTVRRNIKDQLGAKSNKELFAAMPVLKGKSDQQMLCKAYMDSILKEFHKKVGGLFTNSFKEYEEIIKNIAIKPDTSLSTSIISHMESLQSTVIKQARKMIDEQFAALQADIKGMKYAPASIGAQNRREEMLNAASRDLTRTRSIGGQLTGASYNIEELETGGAERGNGITTRNFIGSVVNTMRYMLAGALMGAPTMAMYQTLETNKVIDYNMEKARQNLLAKYTGTGEAPFQKNAEAMAAQAGEKRSVEQIRTEIEDYAGPKMKPIIQRLGMRYGVSQSEAFSAYESATRATEAPDMAYNMTRAALRMSAAERNVGSKSVLTSDEAIKGLSSIKSQWGIEPDQMGRFADMITKASLLNAATVKDVLQVMTGAGSIFKFGQEAPRGSTPAEKKKYEEKAFATSAALAALSVEATGRTGQEMKTFWRNILITPFTRPETAKRLQELGENPLLKKLGIELDPYKREIVNGVEKTTPRDSIEQLQNELEASKALKRAGNAAEANEIMSLVANSRQQANMQSLGLILETYSKGGKKLTDIIDDLSSKDVSNDIDAYIVAMSKTMAYKQDQLASTFQAFTSNVFDEFKPQILSIMSTMTNAFESLSDNAGNVATGLAVLGRVIGSVLIMVGARKLGGMIQSKAAETRFRRAIITPTQEKLSLISSSKALAARQEVIAREQAALVDTTMSRNQGIVGLRTRIASKHGYGALSVATAGPDDIRAVIADMRSRAALETAAGNMGAAARLNNKANIYSKELNAITKKESRMETSDDRIAKLDARTHSLAQKRALIQQQANASSDPYSFIPALTRLDESQRRVATTRRKYRNYGFENEARNLAVGGDNLALSNLARESAENSNVLAANATRVGELNKNLRQLRETAHAGGVSAQNLSRQQVIVNNALLAGGSPLGALRSHIRDLGTVASGASDSIGGLGSRIRATANAAGGAGGTGGAAGGGALSGLATGALGLLKGIGIMAAIGVATSAVEKNATFYLSDRATQAQTKLDAYKDYLRREKDLTVTKETKDKEDAARIAELEKIKFTEHPLDWWDAQKEIGNLKKDLPSVGEFIQDKLLNWDYWTGKMGLNPAYDFSETEGMTEEESLKYYRTDADRKSIAKMNKQEEEDRKKIRSISYTDSSGKQRTSLAMNADSILASADSMKLLQDRANNILSFGQVADKRVLSEKMVGLGKKGMADYSTETYDAQLASMTENLGLLEANAKTYNDAYEQMIQQRIDVQFADNQAYADALPEEKKRLELLARSRAEQDHFVLNEKSLNDQAQTQLAEQREAIRKFQIDKPFANIEAMTQVNLGLIGAKSSINISQMLSEGYTETSMMITKAREESIQQQIDEQNEEVRKITEEMKNPELTGQALKEKELLRLSTIAKVADLTAQERNLKIEGELQAGIEPVAREGSKKQLEIAISKSMLEARGVSTDSFAMKRLERQALLQENSVLNTQAELTKVKMNEAGINTGQGQKLQVEMLKYQSESASNLAKIYKLQYEQSKVAFGLPTGIKAMTSYEYAASRNNATSMQYGQGDLSITVNYGDINGMDKDQFESKVLSPQMDAIRQAAGTLRNQIRRRPNSNYLTI